MNPPSKIDRVVEKFRAHGAGGVARWGGKWLYWNGGLYHASEWADALRKEYKYNKRAKRYGISDPIILFQMGKVGSSTMSASIAQLHLDVPVFTAHTLTNFDAHEQFVRAHSADPTWPLEVLARNRARHAKIFGGRWNKFNVISLVRLPVYRTVSAFFEHYSTTHSDFQTRNAAGTLHVDDLVREFLHNYFHDTAEQWFDSQLKPVFGIDVFAEPFDTARGYQIYANSMTRLLVIRLEDLRGNAPQAMQDFLGIPHFVIVDSNISETKGYGEIYRRFVETAQLPREFIASMHASRYARHFYNPLELEAEARFWTRS